MFELVGLLLLHCYLDTTFLIILIEVAGEAAMVVYSVE